MLMQEIEREVQHLDPNLDADNSSFKTAVLLLAAALMSQDIDALVEFTGYPTEFITERAEKLRKNGVWVDGKTVADWLDPETGGLAFWLDVLVAEGMVEKS